MGRIGGRGRCEVQMRVSVFLLLFCGGFCVFTVVLHVLRGAGGGGGCGRGRGWWCGDGVMCIYMCSCKDEWVRAETWGMCRCVLACACCLFLCLFVDVFCLFVVVVVLGGGGGGGDRVCADVLACAYFFVSVCGGGGGGGGTGYVQLCWRVRVFFWGWVGGWGEWGGGGGGGVGGGWWR